MKSKVVAYVLCFLGLFGLAGIHRFYLGKLGTGILWFLTMGIFFIGTIIDLFTLSRQVDNVNIRKAAAKTAKETLA